jgi:glycosyltransferase involved in cell wall biosynthesis
MIHRVDGPITLYRGYEDNSDRRIQKINSQIADVTIFQSHYSLRAHGTLGLEFKAPIIITNAVDPQIFYPPVSRSPLTGRKVRLISTSWSPNPNKGMPTYKWLEAHLNWDRFEYTFVGTSPIRFNRIRMIPPVPSKELADLLRQHDIYITASQHDPCSNALLEALSCGLPAIYRDSGGHPEIVGKAGFAFTSDENIPDLLTQLVDEYEGRQASITIPTLPEVAERYLVAMNMVQSLT